MKKRSQELLDPLVSYYGSSSEHGFSRFRFAYFVGTILFFVLSLVCALFSFFITAVMFALIGLALLTYAILTLIVARRTVREIRQKNGECTNCGYDLSQTPEQCPECGKTAKPSDDD